VTDGTRAAEPTAWSLTAAQSAAFVEAVVAVSREVGLEPILRRIVTCVTDLVDARYGALGILDDERIGLADFLYVGISAEDAAAIGELPTGRSLLGELIVDPQPLRVVDLATDGRAGGFPAHHPPMSSFLGVPVRVRGEVFGNLYLTDKRGGEAFTETDEQLAVALASVAGVAVENSRLHARVSDLAVIEERERIARDLHDTVIQRIFSVGLALEGMAGRVDDDAVAVGLRRAAGDLDATVRHIRGSIFDAAGASTARPVARELTEFIDEVAGRAGMATSLRIDQDLDLLVGAAGLDAVTESLFAVARDAIVSMREHWAVDRADLAISVGPELTLHIDAAAVDPARTGQRDEWLADLHERAAALGGRMAWNTHPTGVEILWTVPLTAS
jgi:signal transduction histidine kinase